MKKTGRLLSVFMLPVFALLFACGQMGLFDLAKNGVGLVYVVTKDASSNTYLHVTNGDGYYKQYFVGNIPNVIEGLSVSNNGEVFVFITPGFYYSKGDYSQWSNETVFPGSGSRIFSINDQVYAVSGGGAIYFRSDSGWNSPGSFENIPVLANTLDGDIIYCVGNANTIVSYQTNSNTFDNNYNLSPSFTPAILSTVFAKKSGTSFFMGGTNALYLDAVNGGKTGGIFNIIGSDIITAVPSGNAQSYAISDDGEIFAGVADATNIYLLRLVAGGWSNENLPFSGTAAPAISIFELNSGNIAIWAKVIPEQGIYVYNYKKSRLKQITQINPSEIQRVATY